MNEMYPLVSFKRDCFQEFEDEISLVLWCYNCNWKCDWCSLKSIIYDKKNIITENYLDLIRNHTSLETAVVFLGGEPTLHPYGLEEGCKLAKYLGLKTKVFTNGSDISIIEKLIDIRLLDAVSIDYKHYSFNIDKVLKSVINNNISVDVRITNYPGIENLELMKEKIYKYPKATLYIQKYQQF